MAEPLSVLKGARAFARDMPRDAMAAGYLWDVLDFVPATIDTLLTGRGPWVWGSNAIDSDFSGGILASFTAGEQLIGIGGSPLAYRIDPVSGAVTNIGSCPVTRQNPVQLFDQVIVFDRDGAQVPWIITASGAPAAISAGAPNAKVGTVWRSYLTVGGAPGHENRVQFSAPSSATLPWDTNSWYDTSQGVTGLAGLRSIVLVFHAGSVERIRGSQPPAGTDAGDLVLEPLFSQAGLTEPRTIAYWNENVLFADEHGVHITDGAVLRNLASQGSISSYWRTLYGLKLSLSAAVFLDYYIICVNRTDGISETLICDLNKRQWFKFSNIAAVSMWASGGTTGMERVWAGMKGTNRLGRLSACFFPPLAGALAQDANGTYVLPSLETPFYKLGEEGRKRVRFVYLSYDARLSGGTLLDARPSPWRDSLPNLDDNPPSLPPPAPLAAPADVLQCAYITSPQSTTWATAGGYPSTVEYRRWRLPVGKAPYGIAFRVRQTVPTTVTRVSDLAVDVHGIERGRV